VRRPARPRSAPTTAKTQHVIQPPSNITFDLSSLGWKGFQDLCGTVLREVLGQTVTVFPANKDGGRDAAFSGRWEKTSSEAFEGEFVVQCKFAAQKPRLSPKIINPELPKIRRLVRRGLCDVYVLMTNSAVSGEVSAAIRDKVLTAGARWFVLLDGDQIDAYLRERPNLRALVPRVYGLGDLSEVLDDRAYDQARALLGGMQEDLRRFVVTKPYGEAIQALSEHAFVLLLGAPGVGKTMIASALAMAAGDNWGCATIKTDSPTEFARHWNPNRANQFFWIDDAFGTTQYQAYLVDEWNRALPQIAVALRRGAKFVLTSRDYIWSDAQQDLKLRDLTALEDHQVVVDVHDLTLADREQILYNHLKTGGQTREFRRDVKPFLDEICGVQIFLPEVVRQFSNPRFTEKLLLARPSVVAFFSNPIRHHIDVIRALPPDDRAAIALIFMSRGYLPSPLVLEDEQREALVLLGSTPAGVLRGLNSLRGSLVTTVEVDSGGARATRWVFKHPSISDAYSRVIAGDRELLLVYLSGAPLTALMRETTCGDVHLRGALVIPDRYFLTVMQRLVGASKDVRQEDVESYVTSRCNDEFLRLYMGHDPSIVNEIAQGQKVPLAVRLHLAGLLPDALRHTLVSALAARLAEELDGTILNDRGGWLLVMPDDLVELRRRISEDLLPTLDSHVDWLRDNYDASGDPAPDEYLSNTRATLVELRDLLEADDQECQSVDTAIAALDDVQRQLEEDYPEEREPDFDDDWRYLPRANEAVPADSVFSDVDE
jgi:hypothetical protein